MKTIFLYIARLYLINVIVLLVLLFSFVVTVDVTINLNRFAKAATEFADSDGSGVDHIAKTVGVIADLWGPRLLQLFGYLAGVVLVAAMGFTCSQLVRNREFVALLASGISLYRLATPFIAVALLITLAQAIDQEVLIPRVAHLLVRDASDSGDRSALRFRVRLAPDDEGRLFHAARFYDEEGRMDGVTVWQRDDRARVIAEITADTARWDGTGWVLENGEYRGRDDTQPRPVERIDTDLDPVRLKVRYLQGFGMNLSSAQITRIVDAGGIDGKARDRLERVRWGRVAGWWCNIVTLMAALPFFLLRLPQPCSARRSRPRPSPSPASSPPPPAPPSRSRASPSGSARSSPP